MRGMRIAAVLGVLSSGVLLAGSGLAGGAPAAAPPPGVTTYTGVLDPVFWRIAAPIDRLLPPWQRWAINKPGRPPVQADMSRVESLANQFANQRVRAIGKFRSATQADGTPVRYFQATGLGLAP